MADNRSSRGNEFSVALLHGGGQVEKRGPGFCEGEMYNQPYVDGKKLLHPGSQLVVETPRPWSFLRVGGRVMQQWLELQTQNAELQKWG